MNPGARKMLGQALAHTLFGVREVEGAACVGRFVPS
jgi:hypothetical protein